MFAMTERVSQDFYWTATEVNLPELMPDDGLTILYSLAEENTTEMRLIPFQGTPVLIGDVIRD